MASPDEAQANHADSELRRITGEEELCLARVLRHLQARRSHRSETAYSEHSDYDAQLLMLRDELACARLEDVPPLLEQMERLQSLAARRRDFVEDYVDPKSPYFGHLVLDEDGRRREVLIGRGTCVDSREGVRIVDHSGLPVGSEVTLALYGGRREEPVVVEATVLRDDGENGLALLFKSISDSQRQALEKLSTGLPPLESLSDGVKERDGVILAQVTSTQQ